MKLCHLHLQDSLGNKKTLVCHLHEGSIRYVLYGGHGSGGTPFSLSNLQCDLPVDKLTPDETKEDFVRRVVRNVNWKSVCQVVREVDCDVSF